MLNENKEIRRDLAIATQRIFANSECMMSDKVQKSETKTRAEVQGIMKGFVEWRLGHTGDPLSLTIRTRLLMTRINLYIFSFSPENSFISITCFYFFCSHPFSDSVLLLICNKPKHFKHKLQCDETNKGRTSHNRTGKNEISFSIL